MLETSDEKPELIMSSRINYEDVLSEKINSIIRLSDKNKWIIGSKFLLKQSHTDFNPKKVTIIYSDNLPLSALTPELLNPCGYTLETFKQQWETWMQNWDPNFKIWYISFSIDEPPCENNLDDLLA